MNNAPVALVPESEGLRSQIPLMYRSDRTDQNGSFQLRSIVPGSYRVYAWANANPTAFLDPEFIKQWRDRGRLIEIKRGDRLDTTLTALD